MNTTRWIGTLVCTAFLFGGFSGCQTQANVQEPKNNTEFSHAQEQLHGDEIALSDLETVLQPQLKTERPQFDDPLPKGDSPDSPNFDSPEALLPPTDPEQPDSQTDWDLDFGEVYDLIKKLLNKDADAHTLFSNIIVDIFSAVIFFHEQLAVLKGEVKILGDSILALVKILEVRIDEIENSKSGNHILADGPIGPTGRGKDSVTSTFTISEPGILSATVSGKMSNRNGGAASIGLKINGANCAWDSHPAGSSGIDSSTTCMKPLSPGTHTVTAYVARDSASTTLLLRGYYFVTGR